VTHWYHRDTAGSTRRARAIVVVGPLGRLSVHHRTQCQEHAKATEPRGQRLTMHVLAGLVKTILEMFEGLRP
jgi:hypothetical protein